MDSGTLIVGRYRLDRVIAAGGMGSVWRARDELLEREVAVKTLHAGLDESQQSHDRFKREAQTLASLKGQGVVEVYDFGEHKDGDRTVPFLVMELVEGLSLAQLLHQEERLDAERAMRIVAEAAEALATAHGRGIVHRDIKPGNILITPDGRARVIDFGISLFAHRDRLTPTDAVLGTVTYASPEQLRDKDVTGASDLYSLGVVAYECLTGRPPFAATDPAAVIHGHLYSEPPALPEDVPAEVAEVVTKSLRKAPEERWESGEILAAACRAATTGAHVVDADRTTDLGHLVRAARLPAGTPPTTVLPEEIRDRTELVSSPAAVGPSSQPPTEDADAPEPKEEPRKRRRLMLLVLPLIFVVPVTTAVVLTPWNGWSPDWLGDGSGAAETTAAAIADTTPTAGTTSAPATDAATTPEAESTSAAGTEDQDDDPGNGGAEPHDPDPGTDGGTTTEEEVSESGTVPNVLDFTSTDARNTLNNEGFTEVTLYNKQVNWAGIQPDQCEIVEQDPAGGATAAYDDLIRIGYYVQVGKEDNCT